MINFRYKPINSKQVEVIATSFNKTMIMCTSVQEMEDGLSAYRLGYSIQKSFPFLSADEREFLISGMLPEEFEEMWQEIMLNEEFGFDKEVNK